ncbi:cyclin-dependent kinase inhibitor 1C-like [Hordeum vulgare]|nr:cyclin-dependent kinase inhibitor 1C-like [Hordeum vulgare]
MAPPALLLLVLAVTALHAHAASAALSQEPPATPCAAAIVSFSPCLAHVAVVAPPALPSSAPTSACCAAFLRAVSSGDGEGAGGGEGCFCHLLRDPLLLGFPVDAARLGALLPTCASAKTSAATAVEAEALFADKCRELKSLPEMHFTPPSPPPAPKLSPDMSYVECINWHLGRHVICWMKQLAFGQTCHMFSPPPKLNHPFRAICRNCTGSNDSGTSDFASHTLCSLCSVPTNRRIESVFVIPSPLRALLF